MKLGRVFNNHNMFPLTAAEVKFSQNRVCICKQAGLERGICPSPGNKTSPNLWADFILIGINDQLQGGRVNQAFFGEDRFQCLKPQLRVWRQQAVRMVVMIMWHDQKSGTKLQPRPEPDKLAGPVNTDQGEQA